MGRKKYTSKIHYERKKRARINGFLAIDLIEAEYFFQASKEAKAQQVAEYFAEITERYQAKNVKKLKIFLDRNSTHKKKMQTIFAELTKNLDIKVEFHFIAAYSPQLNLVEYVIHWIRQEVLHHADAKKSLADFQLLIETICKKGEILNTEQISHILYHIESLVYKNTIYSPERE